MTKQTTIETCNQGERHLVEYKRGMSGGFFIHLFDAIFKADPFNRTRLATGFPEEVAAVVKFQNESDYWDKLQIRYMNQTKIG